MDSVKARAPLRRFDVFADYNRVKNRAAGLPEDRAKGDAIWLAKVVAGRRGAPAPPPVSDEHRETRRTAREEAPGAGGFRSAGGVPQTDRIFDKEIVERMGAEFYQRVFHPAIEQAFREGKKYEEIRDVLRARWKVTA